MASEAEVLYWLGEGVRNRAVSATQQNGESSRSHLVLTLTLRFAASAEAPPRGAKLLLVDLAGSESVKRTGENCA